MEDGETAQSQPMTDAPDYTAAIQRKPVALNHIICSINAVTKWLEAQARQARRNVIITTGPESATHSCAEPMGIPLS